MSDSSSIESTRAPVGAGPHARGAGGMLFLLDIGPRTPGSKAESAGTPRP